MSRGFTAALFGIAMTLLAWYGSWAWPGWPANLTLDCLRWIGGYDELPQIEKSVVIVLLIMINVGCWGVALWGLMEVVGKRVFLRGRE